MDAVHGRLENRDRSNAMAVDATLNSASRYRAVPCKKRPLSWYKPPVSPAGPVSPGSLGGPVSPASSTSSLHEAVSVAVSPLLWPVSAGAPLLHAVARSLATTSSLTLAALATTERTPVPTPQPAPVRRQSDFSIEHILRDAGRCCTSSSSSPPSSPDALRDDDVLRGAAGTTTAHPEGHFEWLQCTRYRPPKLPRSRRRDGPAQRRLGRNPRIPFSPQQVAILEGRFHRSHYLSSADVAELSAQLELSETRVKIWFQNRRARERRDGEGRSTASPPQQSASFTGPLSTAKAPVPSQLPRSPMSAFSVPKTLQKSTEEKDCAVRVSSALI